jgi:hypothetical protein
LYFLTEIDTKIEKKSKFSIHQEKYFGLEFDDKVNVSNSFVRLTNMLFLEEFKKHGIEVAARIYNDREPYITLSGKLVHFEDIEYRLIKYGHTIRVECKDFCACLWRLYLATGLPISYIKNMYRSGCEKNGYNIIIVFRDSQEYIKNFAEFNGFSIEVATQKIIKRGFIKDINGKLDFPAYGNFLDNLMLPENRDFLAEQKVVCKWDNLTHTGKYYNEKQYMFKLEKMLFVPQIVEEIIRRFVH